MLADNDAGQNDKTCSPSGGLVDGILEVEKTASKKLKPWRDP